MTASVRQFTPRLRGCTQERRASDFAAAIYPAPAGMYLSRFHFIFSFFDLPRACGDVPICIDPAYKEQGFTPRLRGCTQALTPPSMIDAIYPAPAGMYPICCRSPARASNLPRACGGCTFWRSVAPIFRGIYPAPAGIYPLRRTSVSMACDLPRACGDVPALLSFAYSLLAFTPRLRGCTSIAKGEDPINSRSPQHGAVPTRHLLNLPMQLSRVGADNGKTRSIRKTAMQIYYRPIPKCIFEFERIRFSTLVFFKPTLVSFRARCRPPAKPRKPVSPYANITRSQDK